MSVYTESAARRRRLFLFQQASAETRETPNPGRPVPEQPQASALARTRSFSGLTELLRLSESSSWLFTGESYRTQTNLEGAPTLVPPLSGLAGSVLRDQFRRSTDTFVDSTGTGLRVADLVRNFTGRIGRFQPEIAVIALSPVEAEAGVRGLSRFEHALIRLNQHCVHEGIWLILQTPLCHSARFAATEVDQFVYVEAIRGISAEHNLPLVDHWLKWESAVAKGIANDWLDTNGNITTNGQLRMLKTFFAELPLERSGSRSARPTGLPVELGAE